MPLIASRCARCERRPGAAAWNCLDAGLGYILNRFAVNVAGNINWISRRTRGGVGARALLCLSRPAIGGQPARRSQILVETDSLDAGGAQFVAFAARPRGGHLELPGGALCTKAMVQKAGSPGGVDAAVTVYCRLGSRSDFRHT